MKEAYVIGLDLAKRVFHAHGATKDGTVVFRKELTRPQVLKFFAKQPQCIVAMEACGGAHYWGREIGALGHEVRLIPGQYVKPYVKRQKNDAADAEAIAEAASRGNMRFVAVKSAERQADATIFKVRDLLVRQRTQAINAMRSHAHEFGVIAPVGVSNAEKLGRWIKSDECTLPEAARAMCAVLVEVVERLSARIDELTQEIGERARTDETVRRLMTIPGMGPITATAMKTIAPDASIFVRGRDFAAWLGLTPRQKSSGGKAKLGRTSKMGQRDLRRLLIIGAAARVRWAEKHRPKPGTWLARMLQRKPAMLVIVALANKMARIAWALMLRAENYQPGHRAAMSPAMA